MTLQKLYARVAGRFGLASPASDAHASGEVFPQDLIVHITYHKCLTLYYKRIMNRLTAEFPFTWHNYNGDSVGFTHAALEGSGKRIVCLSDRDDVPWEKLPPYRGSHFIRDPRDLIVSGYHYHLWTKETWCQAPDFPWRYYIQRPFFELVEPDARKYPQNVSYQAYLNSLDQERGMILEMIFRRDALIQMQRWNYHNPLVMELRYEEVIGNEPDAFRRLFEHYRFAKPVCARGVEIADTLRLDKQNKGESKHLRRGETQQWKTEMPERVQNVFKQAHGDLLVQLGYARDGNW